MQSSKSVFSVYQKLWDNGKQLSEIDEKIGFCIRNYAVGQIFTKYKRNKNAISEPEKKELEKLVRQLAAEKKSLGEEKTNCSQEEFLEFLESSFANVDEEDRHGEVTMRTVSSFRLLGDLVDILSQWGEMPEKWVKRRKYCKFKSIDIFKALKQGVTPKRGGPKEEENDAESEIKKFTDEVDKNEESENKDLTQNSPSYSEPPVKMHCGMDHLNINDTESASANSNHSKSPRVSREQPENSSDRPKNEKTEFKTNNLSSKSQLKGSMLAPDFQVNEKMTKKLEYELPLKFKSIDYFRLCDVINKQVDIAKREFKSGKVDKSLAHCELALYYLNNIHK